eukprot:scaffold2636_cov340-Pavlova_lutheri.AAC.75
MARNVPQDGQEKGPHVLAIVLNECVAKGAEEKGEDWGPKTEERGWSVDCPWEVREEPNRRERKRSGVRMTLRNPADETVLFISRTK